MRGSARRYLRFWRDDTDADVEEELRFHFEQRVDDYVKRGFSRDAVEEASRGCARGKTRRNARFR